MAENDQAKKDEKKKVAYKIEVACHGRADTSKGESAHYRIPDPEQYHHFHRAQREGLSAVYPRPPALNKAVVLGRGDDATPLVVDRQLLHHLVQDKNVSVRMLGEVPEEEAFPTVDLFPDPAAALKARQDAEELETVASLKRGKKHIEAGADEVGSDKNLRGEPVHRAETSHDGKGKK